MFIPLCLYKTKTACSDGWRAADMRAGCCGAFFHSIFKEDKISKDIQNKSPSNCHHILFIKNLLLPIYKCYEDFRNTTLLWVEGHQTPWLQECTCYAEVNTISFYFLNKLTPK